MRLVCLAAVLALAAASTGCATVAHGSRQTVTITSEPSGAQVTVLSDTRSGARVVRSHPGVTPIQLRLTRRDPKIVIRLEKDGCLPAEVHLKRTASGWTAANLVFANPMMIQGLDSAAQYPAMALKGVSFGFGIDYITGAMFKLPPRAHLKLEPAASLPGPRLCDSLPR